MLRHRAGIGAPPSTGAVSQHAVPHRLVRRLLAAVSVLVLVAGACASEGTSTGPGDGAAGTPPADPPVVAVTTNILADVTREIGGDDVEVLDLMPRGADPHSFGLSAALTAEVVDADLIVANGLGLEEGLVGVLTRAAGDGVPVFEVGPELGPLAYSAEIAATGPDLDPHVWTDPTRMAVAADLLAERLVALTADTDAAGRIRARAAAYAARLDELDAEIDAAVDALPVDRRRLITNHHVFGYFAERYGFDVLGAVIPSGTTLASPSAADLADLAAVITDAGVPAIFAETSHSTRLVEVLASEVGLDVDVVSLYSESLGDEGGPAGTYLDMMRFNALTIAEALGR